MQARRFASSPSRSTGAYNALAMPTAWSHAAAKLACKATAGMPREHDGHGTHAAMTVQQPVLSWLDKEAAARGKQLF